MSKTNAFSVTRDVCCGDAIVATDMNAGINTPPHSKHLANNPFQGRPESYSIKKGVQEICQNTIMAILGISMMAGVVMWCLNQADALED